ncbi:HNH endonuclease [Synechococcus sp. CBW1006]|uniref:HNH endonuclease n=1 Tax=Synechococcus sp. CBW1006 TaxID=1353138 RepID=UPI0018CFA54A|nr:HNH endonuclease [Synechococcus sp. CBW1006]QPN65276.1 hypothetical protein H8F26_09515 [Synechococcus sp. CBW1006]
MTKAAYEGFSLCEEAVAKCLEISREELDEIVAHFDSDPDDQWDLVEGEHFIFVNKSLGERAFSLRGAHAIAEYIRATKPSSFWEGFLEFVTRHKTRIRESLVAAHIVQNSSSLILRSKRHYLSKPDTTKILGTSPARLNRSFQELQAASMMRQGVDFLDEEGKRFYSIRGVSRLAEDLGSKLTSRERQLWCQAVRVTGNKTIKMLASAEDQRQVRITRACELAKQRDKKTCVITGRNRKKEDKTNLVAHHLYSKQHYRHLADSIDNLITLCSEVHEQFHGWNGGYSKRCTPDDLIQFVQQIYPQSSGRVTMIVMNAKMKLGEQSQTA